MFGHPRGLLVLFMTEMWERFSFYGMRALLVLYMVRAMHYSTMQAGQIYGLYLSMVLMSGVAGGFLADRILGQRRAIFWGGLIMAVGHFTLAVPGEAFFFTALVLLVLGCGLFKPNISVVVGQLYAPDDPRRDAAFSIFYMGINIGGFLSTFVCGYLGQRIGWHYGFAAAGVGMVLGLLIYLAGQKHLGQHGMRPRGQGEEALVGDAASLISAVLNERRGVAQLSRLEWQRIAALCILGLVGNVVFFAAFEQAGGSMTLFADQSTRLEIPWLYWAVPSSWFMSANPMFILLVAPFFSWAWVYLARQGKEPSTPVKFGMGLSFLACGFFTMAIAGKAYDASGPVSMWWLILAYFFCTTGELCLAPVGLSLVTKLAPPRFVSFFMGLWFASISLGNLVAGFFTAEYDTMSKAAFFMLPAWGAFAAAVVLMLMARPIRRIMHGVH